MVKEDHLCVVRALNDFSNSEIARLRFFGIHIDHLAIPLVSEEQSIFTVGLYAEVRRVSHETHLHIPIIVTKIGPSR